MPYEANNIVNVPNCTVPWANKNVCRDCTWPPPEVGKEGNCWAKENYRRYYTSEYGIMWGSKVTAMDVKKELFARGPLGKFKLHA